jgi:hypothetical protein
MNNNTGNTPVCDTPQGMIDTIANTTIPIPKECEHSTQKECEHSIIDDLIDIDPDRSEIIYYCKKCYMCFDTIHGNRK